MAEEKDNRRRCAAQLTSDWREGLDFEFENRKWGMMDGWMDDWILEEESTLGIGIELG